MKKRARDQKPATPATLPQGLRAAGVVNVKFPGHTLQHLAKVLVVASGVLQKRGERARDIRAWKLACGINYDRVSRLSDILASGIRELLRAGDTPTWRAVGTLLEKAAADVLDAPIPADVVLMLAFDADDAQASLRAGYGEDAVEKLRIKAKAIVAANTEAAVNRRALLREVTRLAGRDITVELQRVAWDAAPIGLHGGYLRDLAWMFAEVPPALQPLIAAASINGAKTSASAPNAEGIDG